MIVTGAADAVAQPAKVVAMPKMSDAELRLLAAYQVHGTPQEIGKKISDLEKDNGKQRDEIRALKENQPGDDQVVVSKEDADALPKYKDLGKPSEIKGKLEAGEKATTGLAKSERRSSAATFAAAAGFAQETVDTLVSLPDLTKAVFEVKDGKVKNAQGAEVDGKVPFLTVTDDKGATETLDLAKAQERFPALKGLRMASPTDKVGTVEFFKPGPGDASGTHKGNVYDQIRASRKAESDKTAKAPGVSAVEDRLGMSRSQ